MIAAKMLLFILSIGCCHSTPVVFITHENPPYTIINYTAHKGIGYDIVKVHISNCMNVHHEHVDIREVFTENYMDMLRIINPVTPQDKNMSSSFLSRYNDSLIFVGVTSYEGEYSQNFVRHMIYAGEYQAIVVRATDLLLLVKLWSGIGNCFVIIYFSIAVTVIVAAILWLVELRVDASAPSSFGEGLWTNFWFGFVTLSTVGYGDKIPKQFLSKLIAMAWMIFSMMITSMLTATLIESVQSKVDISRENVGVLNNSADKAIAISSFNARPKVFESYDEVLKAVQNKTVKAAVMDHIVASNRLNNGFKNLKVAEVNKKGFAVYWFQYRGDKIPDKCNDSIYGLVDKMKPYIETHYSFLVPPTTWFAREITEIFDDTDNGLIITTSIIAGVIIIIAILTEIIKNVRNRKKCVIADPVYEKQTRDVIKGSSTDVVNTPNPRLGQIHEKMVVVEQCLKQIINNLEHITKVTENNIVIPKKKD